jgi:PPIC-type PPIASE domain
MGRFLKDPLVHFLAIGLLLFGVSAWFGQRVTAGRERIVITAAQVAKIRDTAALLNGHPPTRAELAELIEPSIRDEVLYREALSLKLGANDDEVRRRLIDKMQYLTQDLADPKPTSEAELEAFYDANPERFRVPERVTFDQVFFDPAKHGDAVQSAVAAGLADLSAGKAPDGVGDHTPLRHGYDEAPRDQLEVLFGKAMTAALFTLPVGEWQGPFKSDFGWHLVRIHARSPSRLPPFDEIRDRVLQAFAADRRARRNAEEYARMRSHYDVVVEWPAKTSTDDSTSALRQSSRAGGAAESPTAAAASGSGSAP